MVSKRPTVLIIDDDEAICELVSDQLGVEGYVCQIASSAEEALGKLSEHSFDVALLDIKLPGISGMDLLKTVEECDRMTEVIMMTGVNDVDTAVEAMRLGASDYVVKPFTFDKLRASIGRALKNRKAGVVRVSSATRIGECSRNANDSSLSELDAIAYGVDSQLDELDSHSMTVTERAAELAYWLGLPTKEIEDWVSKREKLHSERSTRIESIYSKLERNPMAQVMLGLSRSVCQIPGTGETSD